MRLLVTGAFVRAARSARLNVPNPTLPSVGYISAARWNSSIAAERPGEAFPEQSVGINREVDPTKTGAQSLQENPFFKDQDAARKAFRQALQDQKEENTVIHSNGLSGTKIHGKGYVFDETTNLSPSILNLVGRKLYSTPNHPICITRKLIESVFSSDTYRNHLATNPVVTTNDNFDVLGFPADHPGRSRTDTYYVDSDHVLRTHTSAHQLAAFQQMARNKEPGYTICADVYRRDSIDRSHFPVFHQMEGARTWQMHPSQFKRETRLETQNRRTKKIRQDLEALPKHNLEIIDEAGDFHPKTNPPQFEHDEDEVRLIGQHLKRSLELLVDKVFTAAKQAGVGAETASTDPIKIRWIEAYFPFTSPSWELEVWWQGEWLELLGCGVVQQPILNRAGLHGEVGWAWGIGIERLAMLLFGIPDIRLFWSTDPRFLSQFAAGKVNKYEPFSKYPACYKDITFWINSAPAAASPIDPNPSSSSPGAAAAAGGDATKASPTETQPAAFHENDIMEIVRDVAGSLAEDVKLVDEFVHPRTGRKSLCYRINYRSLERTLTNEAVNKMHDEVYRNVREKLNVDIR